MPDQVGLEFLALAVNDALDIAEVLWPAGHCLADNQILGRTDSQRFTRLNLYSDRPLHHLIFVARKSKRNVERQAITGRDENDPIAPGKGEGIIQPGREMVEYAPK